MTHPASAGSDASGGDPLAGAPARTTGATQLGALPGLPGRPPAPPRPPIPPPPRAPSPTLATLAPPAPPPPPPSAGLGGPTSRPAAASNAPRAAPPVVTTPVAAAPGPAPAPAHVSPPAAVAARRPAAAAPSLPSIAPTPRAHVEVVTAPAPARRARRRAGSLRRAVRLVVVLGVAGAGWWGALHRDEVAERWRALRGDEVAAEEPAPLAFPSELGDASAVRTAEVVLTGVVGGDGVEYRVRADFVSGVSRVEVLRPADPDLEVLTFGDRAVVRRIDGGPWYATDRGSFPLERVERTDWVRTMDELLPRAARVAADIRSSTRAFVAEVETRHLVLDVDPATLGAAALDPMAPDAIAAPAERATGGGDEPADGAVRVEVWIDEAGLVRRVTGAPRLGAEEITVVSTGTEPWAPTYPSEDLVRPLSATALLELGI